ncbi:siderophore-interacting protein [Umezawaea tangerina]|uniref:NADPH-dependent ferric siderophore reductase n=1 Tax=Umezawaea tangerina TaxID=84725 RepID=A0A2T0SDW8_9PSEU|nr:siderophore-interacting protein [Umezawaea tangerina]PRY31606.1 NADPH-dependent ferric siderophore reductase [Umezawaea tangerina]
MSNAPASDAPKRDRRQVTTLRVLRTERVTPHMIRVVAGGPGLRDFEGNDHTDAYVKVLFPLEGVDYPSPLDMQAVRRDFPRDQWPAVRTYTVRYHDPVAQELAIDFVHHGDVGVAGPWAATVQPGTEFSLLGPGGAYAPQPESDWHLLLGDAAALPAISAAVEHLPAGAVAKVVVEVDGPDEEQKIDSPGSVDLQWVHRSAGGSLVDVVRAMEFPTGEPQAFVHGEASMVKELRRHLLDERGVTKDRLSISGYWRRGLTEDGFREVKAAESGA